MTVSHDNHLDRFRELADELPEIVFETDERGRFVYLNRYAYSYTDYTPEDLARGLTCFETLVPEDRERARLTFKRVLEGQFIGGQEYRMVRRRDEVVTVVIRSTRIVREGRTVGARGVVVDITALRRLEAAVLERERRFAELVERTKAIYGKIDLSTMKFTYMSPQSESILGYKPSEWTGMDFFDRLVHPEDRARFMASMQECLEGGKDTEILHRVVTRDGRTRWINLYLEVLKREGVPVELQGFAVDVTRQKETELALEAAVREREMLLRESNHRIKNNLNMVLSLLNIQARQTPEGPGREALKKSQGRITAIGMLHDMLHRLDDLKEMDPSEYLEGLSDLVVRNFCPHGLDLRVTKTIDPIPMDADTLVPCGLILNELMTNALKHAFEGYKEGSLEFSLRAATPGSPGRAVLCVRDNGRGLPGSLEEIKAGSGLRIVRALVDQLRGTLTLSSAQGEGSHFTVIF